MSNIEIIITRDSKRNKRDGIILTTSLQQKRNNSLPIIRITFPKKVIVVLVGREGSRSQVYKSPFKE